MRWRTLVSLVLMAVLSYGAWAHFNYARAQTVEQVAAQQIEGELWAAQKERCLTEKGTRLREILADRVNKLLARYTEVTGKAYQLPSCSEFGGTD